ncbi:membrane protein insertase YidC [Brachybacterium endophyticum]|uniref:Membrane protein insertase YidC n=1 Tax=Brachybacterium endophyticum TaxID=2182385 RepID=A0A2U2RJC6_9MICO|nr:membrane protein insertase YidC [Brachybacterium endophyticum]PWH05956.1 membrane protein insertase YidC [Brachybacterium endophyticum]
MPNILYPIEWAVAWIMVLFHRFLDLFMDGSSGWTWLLSIVGLTVVVRTLITPLFVRQIRSSRAMQAVAPQLKAVQKKYKGKTDQASRQAMSEETMAIYREAGANPLSSCLPLLLQMPIFFALFRVLFYKLKDAANGQPFGPLTHELASNAYHATLFGDVTIADSFLRTADTGDGSSISTKIVAGVIIALMCLGSFITQKELTMRNMPPSALEGPMASTQKMMMYMLPFVYVITGPGMPIGVLMYWLTTTVWTLGQQAIVVYTYPTPGSPAATAHQTRVNAKREKKGLEPIDLTPKKPTVVDDDAPIRVQPKANKGGKKMSDAERLEAAREARRKAQEERRTQRESQQADGSGNGSKKSGNALQKKGSKRGR